MQRCDPSRVPFCAGPYLPRGRARCEKAEEVVATTVAHFCPLDILVADVATVRPMDNRALGLFQDCITPTCCCPSCILRTALPIAVTRPRARTLPCGEAQANERQFHDGSYDPTSSTVSGLFSFLEVVISQRGLREVRCLLLVLCNTACNFSIRVPAVHCLTAVVARTVGAVVSLNETVAPT